MKVKFDERIELDCVSIPQIVWVTKFFDEHMSDEICCCNGIILYHNLCLLLILRLNSKTYIAHVTTKTRWQVVSRDFRQNQTIWWSMTYGDLTFSFNLQDTGVESMTCRSRVVPQPKLSLPIVASINIIWHRIL